jgi:hypothetical protein
MPTDDEGTERRKLLNDLLHTNIFRTCGIVPMRTPLWDDR